MLIGQAWRIQGLCPLTEFSVTGDAGLIRLFSKLDIAVDGLRRFGQIQARYIRHDVRDVLITGQHHCHRSHLCAEGVVGVGATNTDPEVFQLAGHIPGILAGVGRGV